MTPDVNVLVSAFRVGHFHHTTARNWLSGALKACATGGSVEVLPMVAAGFLRLVTNSKVFPIATSPVDAVAFLRGLTAVSGVTMPALGNEWGAFERLCIELELTGNDIPDAWIAAAVTTNGSHLVTFDRGFGRLLRPSQYTILGSTAGIQERKARYAVRRPQRPSRRARA